MTQLNPHPRRQNPPVINSPNALYVSLNTLFSFFINYLLGRALDYWPIVDSFAHVHRDLWQYSLPNEEWEAIELVAKWLKHVHQCFLQCTPSSMAFKRTFAIF